MHENKYVNKSLYEAFLTGHNMNPNDNCMIYMNKGFKFSYMLKMIEKTALFFEENNIKPNDVITVALPNMPQTEFIIYAANKLGIILHLIHPMSTYEQIVKFTNMTKSKFIFTLDAKAQSLVKLLDDDYKVFTVCPIYEVSRLKTFVYKRKIKLDNRFIDFDKHINRIDSTKQTQITKKDLKATSVLFNGSGTNGISNTIELSDFALNSVCGYGLDMGGLSTARGKYMSSFLPYFHPFGFTICMHMPACFGFCITALPKFSMIELMNYLKAGKINYLVGIPAVFNGLLKEKDFNGDILKKLEASFVGGDFVPNKLIDDYNDLMIKNGSTNRLYQAYGPSETSAATCMNTPIDNKNYTCGKPIDCVKYRIFDDTQNKLVEHGKGELYVSGDSLFNGYYNSKEATKECTYYDENGIRYLKTGDIMEIDSEGFVKFLSRKKRIIKVSGFTIFPSEIEQVSMNVLGVDKVCAIDIPNEKTGSKIVLYCETKENKEIIKEKLNDEFLKYLEPKAIPSEIILTKLLRLL